MTSVDRFAVFLPTQRAQPAHWRWAGGALVLSVVLTAAIVPFAPRPLPRSDLFLPIYQSAVVVVELTTAALLFGQFMILRTVPLLFLVAAYLFGATMAVLHLLSFPGLFLRDGLLGSGMQTTAWLYFGWRGGQALAIAAYAFANRRELAPLAPGSEWRACAWAVAAALGLATGLLALATAGHDALPEILTGSADLGLERGAALVTLALIALPLLLWRRSPSVLDLWLVVVVCVWSCQTALEAVFDSGHFSLGWYAARMFGLSAAGALLVALVAQDSQVHRRLVAARAAEAELRRLSEARLAGREDEYRRIAHELHEDVAQSLALLKLELHGLSGRATAADAGGAARLARADRAVDAALAGVRRVVDELRPPMLDQLGFAQSLEALVDRVMDSRGLVCDLAVEPPAAERLDEPFSTAVFRVVEELLAVAQVAPGSGADASVVVRVGEHEVELRVVLHGQPGPDAMVLDGVRERVLTLAGRVAVGTPAGATEVAVAFPLDPAAAVRPLPP